jgi:ketosteroid isomerase-like protein
MCVLMDTRQMMSEEPTTPDLVERVRRSIEAEDMEAVVSFYAPNAVWDASPWGMGVFEGQAAVRGFFEDWRSSYAGLEWKAEEIRDLGNGVTFAVILQKGRVAGSSGSVQLRYASVTEWADGLIVRNTTYTDIDEAREAAERLAEER